MQNGMGGVDWQALPLAVEVYEVANVEALIERLMAIKGHRPPEDEKD